MCGCKGFQREPWKTATRVPLRNNLCHSTGQETAVNEENKETRRPQTELKRTVGWGVK